MKLTHSLSLSSVLAISTIAISSLSSTTFAKDGAFISGSLGISNGMYTASVDGFSISSNLNSGLVYGADVGYNKNNWSFSGSIDRRSLSSTNFNFFLANAVYNFQPFTNKVSLYFGGGIGAAQAETHNAAAAQLQFGAKLPVNTNFDVFADVRSTAMTYYESNSVTSTFNFVSINIGGKYHF